MRVTEKITFDEYWANPAYLDKKPIRNGSKKMMVGDNIYHRDATGHWHQADSHHSNADGSVNPHNLSKDTKTDKVLHFTPLFLFRNWRAGDSRPNDKRHGFETASAQSL